MEAKAFKSLLDATPFKPFRIQTTRTGRYEITAPTMALLTKTKIYLAKDTDADGIADDIDPIPLAQITSHELI
jgi:hypothetical protein